MNREFARVYRAVLRRRERPGYACRAFMTRFTALLAATIAVGLNAQPKTVTGEWSVVARIPAHESNGSEQRIELVCAFEEREQRLTGSCRPANGPEGITISGTAHDRQVIWSFEIAPTATAQKQTATFRGTVGGGAKSTMKGSVEFGTSRGRFEAKKR